MGRIPAGSLRPEKRELPHSCELLQLEAQRTQPLHVVGVAVAGHLTGAGGVGGVAVALMHCPCVRVCWRAVDRDPRLDLTPVSRPVLSRLLGRSRCPVGPARCRQRR